MKHNFLLVTTDLETGHPMDYNSLGPEPKQVRIHFAEASFPSPQDHADALHRDVSDHVMTLHHFHQILPQDMVSVEHDGQPAYVVTVRGPGL